MILFFFSAHTTPHAQQISIRADSISLSPH